MNIEQKRSWQCRMDQVLLDRKAETVHHYCGNQQRHEEVEVLIEGAAALRCYKNALIEPRIGEGYQWFSVLYGQAYVARWYYI